MLKKQDPTLAQIITDEEHRQKNGLELIASENFVSPAVQAAAGSVLTNKYAEGYPGRRYYGGCAVVDQAENLAIDRVKKLFGAHWANVQPHSGSQANEAVMMALLQPGDTFLGFDLSHGGHLTHGSPVNFSGKRYRAVHYGVDEKTKRVDMDQVAQVAKKEKPKLIICGASAYSRDWDYAAFRAIADEVGALLMTDMAHPAGLIACKLLRNPLRHSHVVTSTTHKTLRGPRGGLILVGKDMDDPFPGTTKKPKTLTQRLDSAVFPGNQGGPLMHIIAAKAAAFGEALQPSYSKYITTVRDNAQAMAKAFVQAGYTVLSGGTDNHSFLLDLTPQGITGKEAEFALDEAGVTVNKNMLPFDPLSPFITSGIRIGTPAITTRGLQPADMSRIVDYIDRVLKSPSNTKVHAAVHAEIKKWMHSYPLHAA